MAFVEIKNLWVHYGRLAAVQGISFAIPKGEVFGFIGPNGAGKSSTIKVLATLLTPTKGNAILDGIDIASNPQIVRKRVGYVPDFFGVYEDLTVLEYLHFFAAAFRINGTTRNSVVADVLELTDLTDKQQSQVDSLSRGMKQRLSMARVLLHDPDLLLLDEPASGLDPRARIEMRELLKVLRSLGKTILISSHILHELSHLCTRVGIIEAGKLVAEGSLDDIFKNLGLQSVVHVQLAQGAKTNGHSEPKDEHDLHLIDKILRIPGVATVDQELDRLVIRIKHGQLEPEDLLESLRQIPVRVRMFQPEALDMETAFMKLTKGKLA